MMFGGDGDPSQDFALTTGLLLVLLLLLLLLLVLFLAQRKVLRFISPERNVTIILRVLVQEIHGAVCADKPQDHVPFRPLQRGSVYYNRACTP